MSYSDDKEIKIDEEEDIGLVEDPNYPPLEEDDDLVGKDNNDPFDSEFIGLDESEY